MSNFARFDFYFYKKIWMLMTYFKNILQNNSLIQKMKERKYDKNKLSMSGLSKQQIELIMNNKFTKHQHLVSSPELIFKIAEIQNNPIAFFKKKQVNSDDRKLNSFQIKTCRQVQNKSRKEYKQIKEKIDNITFRIQTQPSLNLSEIFQYKQNVFAVFLQNFIVETSKQCKQKGQTLRFICNSFFNLIKIVTKKIVQKSNEQNRANLSSLAQAHQKYQNMLINAMQSQKNSLQKQRQFQRTIDGLVYDLRFKRKEIKKLRASVTTCTKRLNQLKTSYLDLQNQHIELLMSSKEIGHENAQFLIKRKLEISKAKFDQLKLKQNKKQIHQTIKQQLKKDTNLQALNLKKQLMATFNDPKVKSIKQIMLDAAFDDFDVRADMHEAIREVDLITINSGLAYIDQSTDMLDFTNLQSTHQTTQTSHHDMLVNDLICNKEVQANIELLATAKLRSQGQSQTQHSYFVKHLRTTYFPVFDIAYPQVNKSKTVQKESHSRKSLMKVQLPKSSKPSSKKENRSQIVTITQIKQEQISICNSIQQVFDEQQLLKTTFNKVNSKKIKAKNIPYLPCSPITPKSTITRRIVPPRSHRGSNFLGSGQLIQIGRTIRSSVRVTSQLKNGLRQSVTSQNSFFGSKRGSILNPNQIDYLLSQEIGLKAKKSKFAQRQSMASFSDDQNEKTKWEETQSKNTVNIGKRTASQEFNFEKVNRALHEKHTSSQLQNHLIEYSRFSDSYNDLLYRRVKTFIRPLQKQLKKSNVLKRSSCQNLSQKVCHKIVGQVYYKCYEALIKNSQLYQMLAPLLSILQLNYGGLKKQDLMEKLKIFITQSLFNRADNVLQIFCFFLGLASSQYSSKVTVIDLHTFLQLISSLRVQGPMLNIVNKMGQLYTSFSKTRNCLPQIFSSLGIHKQVAQRTIQQMEEKYFVNSNEPLGSSSPPKTQGSMDHIQNQKLDLFKVSHFLVQRLIKQKQIYINLFKTLISLACNDCDFQQNNTGASKSDSDRQNFRKITPVFMRLVIAIHCQGEAIKMQKLRQLEQMFPNVETSLWIQKHSQEQFSQMCLRVNVVPLQHSLEYFLLKYQLTPNNYQKYFQKVRQANLSKLIICTNIRIGNLKQQHKLMANILQKLRPDSQNTTNRQKSIQEVRIQQILHFQFLEAAVNEVMLQIFENPMRVICQSLLQFFSQDQLKKLNQYSQTNFNANNSPILSQITQQMTE